MLASLCDFACIALLLPFVLGFCLSIFFSFFGGIFSIVFSTSYHGGFVSWCACSLFLSFFYYCKIFYF